MKRLKVLAALPAAAMIVGLSAYVASAQAVYHGRGFSGSEFNGIFPSAVDYTIEYHSVLNNGLSGYDSGRITGNPPGDMFSGTARASRSIVGSASRASRGILGGIPSASSSVLNGIPGASSSILGGSSSILPEPSGVLGGPPGADSLFGGGAFGGGGGTAGGLFGGF